MPELLENLRWLSRQNPTKGAATLEICGRAADEIEQLRLVYAAAKKVDCHFVEIAQNTASQHGNDPLYRDYMHRMGPMRELDEAVQRFEDWQRGMTKSDVGA
jgi:hypothetical protein